MPVTAITRKREESLGRSAGRSASPLSPAGWSLRGQSDAESAWPLWRRKQPPCPSNPSCYSCRTFNRTSFHAQGPRKKPVSSGMDPFSGPLAPERFHFFRLLRRAQSLLAGRTDGRLGLDQNNPPCLFRRNDDSFDLSRSGGLRRAAVQIGQDLVCQILRHFFRHRRIAVGDVIVKIPARQVPLPDFGDYGRLQPAGEIILHVVEVTLPRGERFIEERREGGQKGRALFHAEKVVIVQKADQLRAVIPPGGPSKKPA